MIEPGSSPRSRPAAPALVSIITPTFNHEGYIEQCVQSVQQQGHTRWEMVIVDDASTDGTVDVVRRLAAEDARVTLIARPVRRGPLALGDSYAEGLARSSGEFVALLDGDDWWARDKLARQVALLDRDPAVVLCYGDCWEVTEDRRAIDYVATPISVRRLRTSMAESVERLSRLCSVPASTVVVRRDRLERIGGFQSHPDLPVVDYPTWLTLSLEGDFVRIAEPLAYWRRHAGSVYWRNLEKTENGCHQFFVLFVDRNRAALEAAGLDASALERNADGALVSGRETFPYFDAKYELMCGDRLLARRKFLRALRSPRTTPRHRLASVVGLLASLSSPRLFSAVLAGRRLVGRRSARSSRSRESTLLMQRVR